VNSKNYAVRLEQYSSIPLAVVNRRASAQELSRVVPEACGTVWNALKSQNIAGAGRHVALYLDDQINLQVGVELAAPFTGVDEVVPSAIPAGAVATVTHFGPYHQLAAAHDAIHGWCSMHHHKLSGPRWEIYDHWKDECNKDPSAIRTDVYYLLSTRDSILASTRK